MKKNFLFLLGTQKAGSTYTAMMLKKHPQYWNGGTKEMRYWNNYFKSEEEKNKIIKKFLSKNTKQSNLLAENLKGKGFSKYF